ncbi:MAG: ABC transporter ATP-binding protein [Clostridia bacterium]|nr:ABC transporter ATP-binding protein [Clostridia bacterium]
MKTKKPPQNKPAHSVISNIHYVLSMLCEKHKGFVIFQLFFAVYSCLENILPVLFLKMVIDLVTAEVALPNFLTWSTIIALALLVLYLVRKWYAISLNPIGMVKVKCDMRVRLLQKAKKIEYAKFDQTDFFDLYSRSISEAENRSMDVLFSCCEFITAVCSLAGISAVILSLNPLMILISAAMLVGEILIDNSGSKLIYQKDTELLPINRQNNYIKRLFYQKQFAKEIKIFSISEILFRRQKRVADDLIESTRKYGRKLMGVYSLAACWEVLYNIGIDIYCAALVLLGQITFGDFTALRSTAQKFISQIGKLFDIIPNMKKHSLYINDFRKFMEEGTEKQMHSLPAPDRFASLELQNASFTYEGSGFSLKDLSLTIHKGEKIAIVGENGSGKSTLIKMLMNLYHPESGKICYNGKSYDEYDDEALHSSFGAVFQDIQSYDMTIAEYVLLREYTEADYPLVWDALKKSGLYDFVKKLPKGLETHISTEFNPEGMELSGGQLQKLAIARIYAGDYDFIILDEPTSALDPRSEYEFNKTLFDIAKDKTVIFISHRLSTTRFADKIYLMDGGRIVEAGSHEQLMHIEKGHYRELFDMQAEYYVESAKSHAA